MSALPQESYFRSGWNVLDGLIVITALINLAASSSSLKSIRSLRALRALRPLRAVSRYPGLRVVVMALFGSIPQILNMLFVILLFFLIFAIVCVGLLKGALATCSDNDGWSSEQVTCCCIRHLHSSPWIL